MSLRVVSGSNVQAKAAVVTEVRDSDGQWWLYYTIGADLSTYIERYSNSGYTVGDPDTTPSPLLPSVGLAKPWEPATILHRRPIVKRNDGPSADQAKADTEAENEYPLTGKDDPVSYVREHNGQTWLVYCKGEHLKQVIRDLWKQGKAIGRVEVACLQYDEDSKPEHMTFRGAKCYRRLIVPKEQGINPQELGLT